MILDKRYERTAKAKDIGWDVKDSCSYRWLYPDETPASDWFREIDDALVWIKKYDRNRVG